MQFEVVKAWVKILVRQNESGLLQFRLWTMVALLSRFLMRRQVLEDIVLARLWIC